MSTYMTGTRCIEIEFPNELALTVAKTAADDKVGVQLASYSVTGETYAVQIVRGSLAEAAELKVLDKILRINDYDITGVGANAASELLAKAEGKIELVIYRPPVGSAEHQIATDVMKVGASALQVDSKA